MAYGIPKKGPYPDGSGAGDKPVPNNPPQEKIEAQIKELGLKEEANSACIQVDANAIGTINRQITKLKAEIDAINAATVSRIRTQSAKRDKQGAHILNLNSRLAELDILMGDWNLVVKHILANTTELKAKLKETIKAIEKLAKGKSLGALGLPTEESWNQPS